MSSQKGWTVKPGYSEIENNLRRAWQEAVEDSSYGLSLNEVFDPLEQKYKANPGASKDTKAKL
jgi:hypothetical protein